MSWSDSQPREAMAVNLNRVAVFIQRAERASGAPYNPSLPPAPAAPVLS